MKKKIVLALLTATMAGAALTGCGGKTTETASEEIVETTDEASDEDVETSEETAEDSAAESLDENDADNAEATDEEATAEGEETVSDENDIDESALLESEIPDDPEEVVAIIKSIKDYDIRCEYALKANNKFDGNDEASLKWADLIYPYWQPILDKTDIEE